MHTSSGVSNGWGSSGCYCLINLSTKTDYIVVHAKDESAESYNASHREEALSPLPPNLYINLWQLLKSFKLLVVSIFNCNATLLFIVHQWNLPKKKKRGILSYNVDIWQFTWNSICFIGCNIDGTISGRTCQFFRVSQHFLVMKLLHYKVSRIQPYKLQNLESIKYAPSLLGYWENSHRRKKLFPQPNITTIVVNNGMQPINH